MSTLLDEVSATTERIATVLHAYVDESYCEDWFFMVAAIAANPLQVIELDEQLFEIVRTETERLAIPQPPEVHGYDLFQGVGDWGHVQVHERLAVAGKVFDALRESDVRFIIRGINRAAQRRRYPKAFEPYPLVLTHLMREVNKYAEANKTQARIICDEIHQHDRHRAMLERHRLTGTPGYNRTTLGAVAGSLDFIPSVDSPMIQAADIVAYLRHRVASRPSPARPERRARARLWAIVEDQVVHDFCWHP